MNLIFSVYMLSFVFLYCVCELHIFNIFLDMCCLWESSSLFLRVALCLWAATHYFFWEREQLSVCELLSTVYESSSLFVRTALCLHWIFKKKYRALTSVPFETDVKGSFKVGSIRKPALKVKATKSTLKVSLLTPVLIGTDFKSQVLTSFFVIKLTSFLL